MDQNSQTSVPVKNSPLTKTYVERESRKSMCFFLLIQSRAVLVLECQQSVGPPAPSWIQSYNSPHMAGIGLKKIPNNLPAWQVALASIVSPIHFPHVEIDGAQYQDINTMGYIDLHAAIYAEVCQGDGYVGSPITVSISPESSKRSNVKNSKAKYFGKHAWAGYASNLRAAMSQLLHEDPHRHYRFEISQNVHDRSSRSIGKIKALSQSIERKLPALIKYIPDVLRGSNSREQVETSGDETSRTVSSLNISTKDDLGGSAKGHETLNFITKFTEAYLLREDVQTKISECAQTLVGRRRHRAQVNFARWRRQCYGLRYQCVYGECVEDDVEYADQDALTLHLLQRHPHLPLHGDNLESMLDHCMRIVL